MKVLVLGASGFIGKNFIENCPKDLEIIAVYNSSDSIEDFVKEKNLSNVQLFKCDLTNRSDIVELSEEIGKEVEHCLYLAGNVNVPLSIERPDTDFKLNVSTLVNFFSVFSVNRMIYLSTAGVYDGIIGKASIKSSLNPKVPYCMSKMLAEQVIDFFSRNGKLKEKVIVRFSGAFGPYAEGKFVNNLVKSVVSGGKNVSVYGDGNNFINVMYIKDTVDALLSALRSSKADVVCNLGQDNQTIKELVDRCSAALGSKVEIKFLEKRPDQKYITFTYDSDFNKIFGFKPKYSFEEGIKEFGDLIKNET